MTSVSCERCHHVGMTLTWHLLSKHGATVNAFLSQLTGLLLVKLNCMSIIPGQSHWHTSASTPLNKCGEKPLSFYKVIYSYCFCMYIKISITGKKHFIPMGWYGRLRWNNLLQVLTIRMFDMAVCEMFHASLIMNIFKYFITICISSYIREVTSLHVNL